MSCFFCVCSKTQNVQKCLKHHLQVPKQMIIYRFHTQTRRRYMTKYHHPLLSPMPRSVQKSKCKPYNQIVSWSYIALYTLQETKDDLRKQSCYHNEVQTTIPKNSSLMIVLSLMECLWESSRQDSEQVVHGVIS